MLRICLIPFAPFTSFFSLSFPSEMPSISPSLAEIRRNFSSTRTFSLRHSLSITLIVTGVEERKPSFSAFQAPEIWWIYSNSTFIQQIPPEKGIFSLLSSLLSLPLLSFFPLRRGKSSPSLPSVAPGQTLRPAAARESFAGGPAMASSSHSAAAKHVLFLALVQLSGELDKLYTSANLPRPLFSASIHLFPLLFASFCVTAWREKGGQLMEAPHERAVRGAKCDSFHQC